MGVVDPVKSEVRYLVSVESEKRRGIHIAGNRETKSFTCSAFHGVHTVLYVYSKLSPVSEVAHYFFFQIGYSYHQVCYSVLLEPFNNPFEERFPADINQSLWNIMSNRPYSKAFST